MAIYDPKSMKAEEFINDEEIRQTLAYAQAHKNDAELVDALLEKARPKKTENGVVCSGLTHREASVLLACDLPDKIKKMYALANEGIPLNLTVSLHATSDEDRARVMPVAKAYKIEEILKACAYYFEKTGRRYYFEYTLIEGENCDEEHARALLSLLKGKPCHVNLIRLNEVKERNLKSTGEKDAYRFLGILEKGGLSATLRRQIGSDIGGACGQLRASYLEDKKNG